MDQELKEAKKKSIAQQETLFVDANDNFEFIMSCNDELRNMKNSKEKINERPEETLFVDDNDDEELFNISINQAQNDENPEEVEENLSNGAEFFDEDLEDPNVSFEYDDRTVQEKIDEEERKHRERFNKYIMGIDVEKVKSQVEAYMNEIFFNPSQSSKESMDNNVQSSQHPKKRQRTDSLDISHPSTRDQVIERLQLVSNRTMSYVLEFVKAVIRLDESLNSLNDIIQRMNDNN